MTQFQVEFFKKRDTTEPAREFLDSLDTKMMAKMVRTISLLQSNGPSLREPYSKPIDDGIFELRAKLGSDIHEFYTFSLLTIELFLQMGLSKRPRKHQEQK